MGQVRSIVLGTLVVLALFQGGCSGCSGEDYYCDETGCYYCDSYGCRPVDPPEPVVCRGDWECEPGEVCTRVGCAPRCAEDSDCPPGLDCRDGLCLRPGPVSGCSPTGDCESGYRCEAGECIVELDPGLCPSGTGGDCDPGEVCAPSLCCLPAGEVGVRCCADVDCAGDEVCRDHACETVSADDGGTRPDGGVDVPHPEPQCLTNADCPVDGYLCIDGVCKLPCRSDAECGPECRCVDGFCTGPAT